MLIKQLMCAYLLCTGALTYSMMEDITLPNAQVIKERFKGFEVFLEATKFANNVAEKKVMPIIAATLVDRALYDYDAYIGKNIPDKAHILIPQNRIHRKVFVQLLLKEHPEALAEMKAAGAL